METAEDLDRIFGPGFGQSVDHLDTRRAADRHVEKNEIGFAGPRRPHHVAQRIEQLDVDLERLERRRDKTTYSRFAVDDVADRHLAFSIHGATPQFASHANRFRNSSADWLSLRSRAPARIAARARLSGPTAFQIQRRRPRSRVRRSGDACRAVAEWRALSRSAVLPPCTGPAKHRFGHCALADR